MNRFIFILLTFIFSIPSVAQKNVAFDLTFGSYLNDHYKHEYHTVERNWQLNGSQLIYAIDAHKKRYADTLQLNTNDLDTIHNYIFSNKFSTDLERDLSVNYFDKNWIVSIKGTISVNAQMYKISIKANSPTLLEKDVLAQKLKNLEDILYTIIEQY